MTVGRTDWQNLVAEHTPYELAVLQTYENIEPYGERRADLRMAVQTLNLLQAQASKQFTPEQTEKIVAGLVNYLGKDEPQNITPDEAARMGKAAFAKVGK